VRPKRGVALQAHSRYALALLWLEVKVKEAHVAADGSLPLLFKHGQGLPLDALVLLFLCHLQLQGTAPLSISEITYILEK
jgi:hypothetical protein